MTTNLTISDAMPLLKNRDLRDLVIAVVASIIFVSVARAFGLVRRIKDYWYRGRRLRSYRARIRKECASLIVIGRKERFDIDSVFVNLDIVRSSLSADHGETEDLYDPAFQRSFVLLGGPGAGKSTMAKRWILDTLQVDAYFPIFVRLRDYTGSEPIIEYLAKRIDEKNQSYWREWLVTTLLDSRVFCIFDGLDEVRPASRDTVCQRINQLIADYFSDATDKKRVIVTCRKEAYRDLPLNLKSIFEVRPLTDTQIQRFAKRWPQPYPEGKSSTGFWEDLESMPRILELARSPLLLVGGLVQYTESNLGLPEERVQYLARVARWLIEEWATAQGHPPDRHRPLYDRLLPRLAFEMHVRGVPEMSEDDVRACFCAWLPSFGYSNKDASEVLENIAKRTGILVREAGGMVVFAQFGLHEYFASLQAADQTTPEELADLGGKPWWREVVLLAIAQQRDPTRHLEALFNTNHVLAIAAVAECLTPPMYLTERAVAIGLAAIDSGTSGTIPAVVALLRKTEGGLEAETLKNLEMRLARGDESSAVSAEILAVVGTASASGVLLRHPELWERTLSAAGHLSENFENVLIEWMFSDARRDYALAARLVTEKASLETIFQLTERLSSLPHERADLIAELIMGRLLVADASDVYSRDVTERVVSAAARAVTYLSQPKAAAATIVARLYPEQADRDKMLREYEGSAAPTFLIREGARMLSSEFYGAVYNCLFLAAKWPGLSYKEIVRAVTGSISFRVHGIVMVGGVCSSFLVLANSLHSELWKDGLWLLAFISFCGFLLFVGDSVDSIGRGLNDGAYRSVPDALLPFMLGMVAGMSRFGLRDARVAALSKEGVVMQSALYALTGFIMLTYVRALQRRSVMDFYLSPSARRVLESDPRGILLVMFSSVIPGMALAAASLLLVPGIILTFHTDLLRMVLSGSSLLVAFGYIFALTFSYRRWILVKGAPSGLFAV